MGVRTRLTSVDEVPERGSYLFTVVEPDGSDEEVFLVRCADDEAGEAGDRIDGEDGVGVRAWKNFCLHETDQRLDRGIGNGVAIRDGEIICPRHGSAYDACSGHCDEGKAAGTDLLPVDVEVENGDVYLTDDELQFKHEGPIEDEDDGPDSTSHINF